MSRKSAFVIGASRGLGLETAMLFKQRGYRVVATSSRADHLQTLREEHELDFEFLDLAQLDRVPSSVREILTRHGVPDVVVLNGAIGSDKLLATMHDSEIALTINTNFTGTLLATKYFSRAMMINGSGALVIIGSITAHTGYSGLAAYGGAKAGLEGAIRGLTRELGKRGVRINIVHPGFMDTAMTRTMPPELREKIEGRSPFKRFVSTTEVSNAVYFLGSDESSGIAGTSLVVDLGATS